MAEVGQREWKLPGQRTKRLAWGFTVTINGKRVRQYRSEWSKDDAERELAKVKLGLEQPKAEAQAPGITFGEAVKKYLAAKGRKRSIAEDRRQLEHLKLAFVNKVRGGHVARDGVAVHLPHDYFLVGRRH